MNVITRSLLTVLAVCGVTALPAGAQDRERPKGERAEVERHIERLMNEASDMEAVANSRRQRGDEAGAREALARMEELSREARRLRQSLVREGEGDRPRDGERERPRDGDRPREGDRERPRDGDRPREGDRERPRDGDRPREGDRERPRGDAPEGRRPRLEALERHAARLREEGKGEEAERVEREIEELRRRPRPDRPGPQAELQRRIHELERERDRAAEDGREEDVRNLERAIDDHVRELERVERERGPRGPREPMMDHVHRLGEEVERLRGEMNEVRELLRELLRKLER